MIDVLIVGAGPVGVFLALLLRARGLEVALVDRRHGVVFDPRAAVIWPRTAEMLARHGLGAAFATERQLLEGVEIQVRGVSRGAMRLGQLDGPEPLAWIIEQHRTEAVLRQAFATAVDEGLTLTGLTQDDEGVTAMFSSAAGPRELRARYLVGCDGAQSTVRTALGIEFEGGPHEGLDCLQVNAECVWRRPPAPGFCRFDLTPGATLLAVPLPSAGYRFVSFRKASGAPTQPTVEEAEAQLSHIAHEPLRLRPTEPRWLTRARFRDRVARRLRVGRVALCGDAAAAWTPIGGRGMNVGLLSAERLAWRLAAVARDEAPVALLDDYDAEVRAVAKRIIRTLRWNRLEYPSNALTLTVIDWALASTRFTTTVPAPIERLLSLYDLDPGRSLRRFPNGKLGGSRRGHGLLSPGRWTLVGLGCTPAALPGVEVREAPVLDETGKPWLKPGPGLTLVRPDGVIAASFGPDAQEAVLRSAMKTTHPHGG